MLKGNGLQLELFRAEGDFPGSVPSEAGPKYPCYAHLCFAVTDLDAKLRDMGTEAKLTLGPLDMGAFIPGMRVAWVADPSGNIIELNQGYVDEENPPPLAD
jgi:glyoxylase I family protein